jgi:hypothetical protein
MSARYEFDRTRKKKKKRLDAARFDQPQVRALLLIRVGGPCGQEKNEVRARLMLRTGVVTRYRFVFVWC